MCVVVCRMSVFVLADGLRLRDIKCIKCLKLHGVVGTVTVKEDL